MPPEPRLDGERPAVLGLMDRAKAALGEYLAFLARNATPEAATEAARESLGPEKRPYSIVDRRFMALTYSTTKAVPGFSGIERGEGLGFLLLKAAGFDDHDIKLVKQQVPELVGEAYAVARTEANDMVTQLPHVDSIHDLPRIHPYEATVSPDFFAFLGEEGPALVKRLVKECGLTLKDTVIRVHHDPQRIRSSRVTNQILFMDKDGRELKAAYRIKIPYNQEEVEASVYAAGRVVKTQDSEKTLGPKVVRVGDYLIEEDLSLWGDDLRKTGFTLTAEEASVFGRQMALDLATMCQDRIYLYPCRKPVTHIKLTGKGKELITQRVGWVNSKRITDIPEEGLTSEVVKRVREDAFLIRGELLRGGPNTSAWGAYTSTLTDPSVVADERTRGVFREAIRRVEAQLTDERSIVGTMPVGKGARGWQEFFKDAKAERLLPERTRGEVKRSLMEGENGLLNTVTRTLKIDLQRANIIAPEVASALVDDLIGRVRIQDYIQIQPNQFVGILDDCMKGEGIKAPERKRIKRQVRREIVGRRVYSFDDAGESLVNAFRENSIHYTVRDRVLRKVKDGIEAELAGSISFSAAPGEVTWERDWATHILVHGPEPEGRVLMVYRFKPTHTMSPGKEMWPSRVASDEETGPKVVWSDEEHGIILEEYVQKVSVDGLNEKQVRELGRNCASMIYRMFNVGRYLGTGKSIHSFDGFERGHFNVIRVGRSLKPCLVDYGQPRYLHRGNRVENLETHVGVLLDEMRGWPHPAEAYASFETWLEFLVSRRGPESILRQDITEALRLTRLNRADRTKTFLWKTYKGFFDEVDGIKRRRRED